MEIKIDSDVLNRFNCGGTADIIPVFLDNHLNKIIGRCHIYLDKSNGHIYADLSLDENVSLDLYVYYYNTINGSGWCEIENIGLHSKPRNDKGTKTLKELMIS